MTSIKTKITLCLCIIFLIVEESWQGLRFGALKDVIVNWWIAGLDYPYSIQWYIKDNGIYWSFLLHAYVMFRLSVKAPLLCKFFRVLMIYRGCQIASYFLWFDWLPVSLLILTLILGYAFFCIKTHKENPYTVINYKPQ